MEGFHRTAYPSDKLSQREIETLALVLVGFTLRMTSMIQGVTLGTIKKRWQLTKDKLGIRGKNQSFKNMLLEWYEMLNMYILHYINETIKLQIEMPFEFIDSCARELQNAVNQQARWLSGEPPSTPKIRLIKKSKQTTSNPIQQQFSAIEIAKVVVQAIINTNLRSLFDAHVAILDIQDPEQRDSLWSSFQKGIIYYLLQSIKPYFTIDITGLTNLLNEELALLSRPSEVPQLLEISR